MTKWILSLLVLAGVATISVGCRASGELDVDDAAPSIMPQ